MEQSLLIVVGDLLRRQLTKRILLIAASLEDEHFRFLLRQDKLLIREARNAFSGWREK